MVNKHLQWMLMVAFGVLCAACTTDVAAPQSCTKTSECPGGWVCDGAVCVVATPCISNWDCCPGATCLKDKCVLPEFPCGPTHPCTGTDQVCSSGVCLQAPRLEDSECHANHRCAAGVCSPTPPCGGCSPNEACVPAAQRCLKVQGSCLDVQCKPGELRVVVNVSATLGLQCESSNLDCGCVPLPEVERGTPGFWGNSTVVNDSLVHVGYDPHYGDLVLQRFDITGPLAQTSTAVRTLWLDGVPDGPIEGRVSGPRGGVAEPGPDVGRYAAVVSDAETLYAAYRTEAYEQESKGLRFATILPAKEVVLSFKLLSDGDPGHHNAIVVQKQGFPVVATMLNGDNNDTETALVVLFASGKNPTGPESFPYRVTVDSRVKEFVSPSKLDRVLRGTGLFPALGTLPDAGVAVAWYDSDNGALWLAHVSEKGVLSKTIVDGALGAVARSANTEHDVGRHTSLAVAPNGTIFLAYQDVSDRTLRLYIGPVDGTGDIRIADDGGGHWVGGGTRLLLIDGKPWIAHGDETTGDLRLTRELGTGYSSTPVYIDGVHGFFPTLARYNTVLIAGSLQLALTPTGVPTPGLRFVPIALSQ